MKANQRFTLMATALSCIVCAGTTLALVSLNRPLNEAAPGPQSAGELRPSLAALPEPLQVPSPTPVARPSNRLSFVRPDVGPLEPPIPPADVAATPDSWSVEVKELPTAYARQRNASAKARTARARKAGKTRYTLKQRLAEISPAALARVTAKYEKAKASWPPAELAFVAIKDNKALEVYSRPQDGEWQFVHRYKVLAASGASGPKLQRGDKQVPEGVYRISYLNPNSAYHVSLRVNYPNSFDRQMAKKDGRKDLGGDIMIHGKNVSAGCLAVGDPSAEELFVLAAEVGMKNVKVIIAPTDFRRKQNAVLKVGPEWVPELYTEIASAMGEFKAPPSSPPGLLTLLGF